MNINRFWQYCRHHSATHKLNILNNVHFSIAEIFIAKILQKPQAYATRHSSFIHKAFRMIAASSEWLYIFVLKWVLIRKVLQLLGSAL